MIMKIVIDSLLNEITEHDFVNQFQKNVNDFIADESLESCIYNTTFGFKLLIYRNGDDIIVERYTY